MLAPWFTKSSSAKNYTAPKSSTSLLSEPSHVDLPRPKSGPTRAITTPHDATLAQLYGHTTEPAPDLEEGASTEDIDVAGSASYTGTHTPAVPEVLYDPFSGAELGVLAPIAGTSDQPGGGEELWNHLSRVLELQSDIAGMHGQMEGIGGKASDTRGQGKHKGNWAEEGEAEEEGGEEAEKSRKLDEEFERLGDKFSGRKDAIDAIMNKLGELSQEVTLFHSLVTPVIDFSASRANSSAKSYPVTPTPSKPRPLMVGVLGEHTRHDSIVESPISGFSSEE